MIAGGGFVFGLWDIDFDDDFDDIFGGFLLVLAMLAGHTCTVDFRLGPFLIGYIKNHCPKRPPYRNPIG